MPEVKLRELVDFIKPRGIIGKTEVTIHRVDPINAAYKGSLSFATKSLWDSDASVVICSEGDTKLGQTLIFVDNPRLWFIRCMRHFFNPDDGEPWIHPTAVINHPVVSIGKRVRIGPGATIGFDGFGYEINEEGSYEKFPSRGRVIIGDDVDIGANTCIDRGSLGDTVIGDGTKIDNLVHIAHNAWIGKNCIIIAQSCIAGSARIEDGAWIAPHGVVRNGVTVGEGAVVGMGAVVIKDVKPHDIVMGVPARPKRKLQSHTKVVDNPEIRREK